MFIMVIAGTGLVQGVFPSTSLTSGKDKDTAPGNLIRYTLGDSNDTFDTNQTADTHATPNVMFPVPVEIQKIQYMANATQVYTDDNLELGLVVPANNITTVANAIAVHKFADNGGAGDVVNGVYQSAKSGSVVCAADTLYEIGVVVQPTGGTVAAVAKGIYIWASQIPNTQN